MAYLVIGLGSMGCRRLRLLREILTDAHIIGVDQKQERRLKAEKDFQIDTYESISSALQAAQVTRALVCTSPLSHYHIIRECLMNDLHVFTEINLVDDGYNELMEIARERNLKLFLSSTLMYRKEIEYIQKRVRHVNRPCFYRYHVGQYLPDWHPWEGYKDFFVGDKRTNGCREIFGIEMPWVIDTFGRITSVKVNKSRLTSLDIDFPDAFTVQIGHESGHFGVFLADVVARSPIRDLEIVAENLQIRWDQPGVVLDFDIDRKQFSSITMAEEYNDHRLKGVGVAEAAYRKELDAFQEVIEGGSARYGFLEDQYTLSVIDRIEGFSAAQ